MKGKTGRNNMKGNALKNKEHLPVTESYGLKIKGRKLRRRLEKVYDMPEKALLEASVERSGKKRQCDEI
ncbi:hypothetical protein U1Q18_035869 [Sarracenia purpurea var. burkii]